MPPFELTIHGQKALFVYDAALRQRFREAHDAIELALDTLAPAASATVGSGVPAGGQTAADLAAADPDSRPFASPRFWAGFTITGWGCLPLRLRGDGDSGGRLRGGGRLSGATAPFAGRIQSHRTGL